MGPTMSAGLAEVVVAPDDGPPPAPRETNMSTKTRITVPPPIVVGIDGSATALDAAREGFEVRLLSHLCAGVMPDTTAKAKKPRRVVLCSGKVYYDLLEEAQKQGLEDVALVRVEQLYPFPREELAAELARFGKVADIVWCQEEPQNQGPWFQIRHHLVACLQDAQSLHYAGRTRSPSPACGHYSDHVLEQAQLVADALTNPLADDDVVDE